MKECSNQKVEENKPALKFNFTLELGWNVFVTLGYSDHSQRALVYMEQTVEKNFIVGTNSAGKFCSWYTLWRKLQLNYTHWRKTLFQVHTVGIHSGQV